MTRAIDSALARALYILAPAADRITPRSQTVKRKMNLQDRVSAAHIIRRGHQ